MLESGGNAFDAVVAAGFAACVAEPCLTSLGGGGFMLAAPSQGTPTLFDFFAAVPGLDRTSDPEPIDAVDVDFDHTTQTFYVGAWSVAVPGTASGLVAAHRALGRLPLGDVVAPAADLARNGCTIDDIGERFITLLTPILTSSPSGRRLFAPDDRVLRSGDRFTNPELGEVCEAIGTGGDVLPSGWAGPAVTDRDAAEYRVVERRPLRFRVGEVEVMTNPSPSLGGRLLETGLRALEVGPAEEIPAIVEAQRAMTEMRSKMGSGTARGTTHINVADEEGNLVAMTCSNGSGSGWFAEGTGIQLNNMMGEDDLHPSGRVLARPGTRIGSMMAPTVLALEDGRRVALGSGGSERIRTALLQVIRRITHHGDTLAEATNHHRVHLVDGVLQVEPDVEDIPQGPWTVNRWPITDVYFGGAHAVDDRGHAAGDHRRGGSVWTSA